MENWKHFKPSITYGDGYFVAVNSQGHIAYSSDGISWKEVNVGTQNFDVIYAGGKFVAPPFCATPISLSELLLEIRNNSSQSRT